jgi:phenylacetate-CoA ligase
LVYGYASAVNQLAELFQGEELPSRSVRIAVVTSEVLEPAWRENIEASVAQRVFNLYGSQEGAHAALQCSHGRLHVNPTIGVLELLDHNGMPVSAGDSGRVVVTTLMRRSFPLIRYDIGDVARSTEYAVDCACGLKWPSIGDVEGRSEDLVRTGDGRRIGYLCFHATKDLSGIKEAQLIQRDYESFECLIVPSETEVLSRANVEASIRENINRRLQVAVDVRIRYVDTIPRSARGKFKAVVVDF